MTAGFKIGARDGIHPVLEIAPGQTLLSEDEGLGVGPGGGPLFHIVPGLGMLFARHECPPLLFQPDMAVADGPLSFGIHD